MTATQTNFSDYLTVEQLAEQLGVTTRTVRRWQTLRVGPPRLKCGPRRVLYKVEDVKAWLDSGAQK